MEIIKIFIVTATIYHAVPEQTDADYLITASGSVIEECCAGSHRWLAVSRDLEDEGLFFGAKVYVTGTGDRMNKRWTNRIDFLVDKDITGGKWEDVEIRLIK